MDLVAGLSPGLLVPSSLLGICILAIIMGRLIPKPTVDRMETQQDAEKARLEREADKWREAYMNEREARATSEAQTGELLTLARATNALLAAIPRPTPE